MSAEADKVSDSIEVLDDSIRDGAEFEQGKTVVGGLYAIAVALDKLSKQLESAVSRRAGGGGAL